MAEEIKCSRGFVAADDNDNVAERTSTYQSPDYHGTEYMLYHTKAKSNRSTIETYKRDECSQSIRSAPEHALSCVRVRGAACMSTAPYVCVVASVRGVRAPGLSSCGRSRARSNPGARHVTKGLASHFLPKPNGLGSSGILGISIFGISKAGASSPGFGFGAGFRGFCCLAGGAAVPPERSSANTFLPIASSGSYSFLSQFICGER